MMDDDVPEKDSLGNQPLHRPLTRVAIGPKVPIGPLSGPDIPQRLAPIVTVCPSSPGPQRADLTMARADLSATGSTGSKGSAELQDSCYSSESEHSSLSRNTSAASETLAQEYGPPCSISTSTYSLATDLAQQLCIRTGFSQEPGSSKDGEWYGSSEYSRLADFAVKLGFTQQQLDFVLNKLGVFPPEQDRVLSELTKLGKQDLPCISAQQSSSACFSDSGQLRTVVIDGSNLAMTHGHKEVFSCLGVRECVDFFRKRGHSDIKVFVPQFRRETPRPDCPITDQHILFELESEGVLVWTPSRRVGGRRIVCHDDRYILKTAAEKEAVIVSNDEYRDLMRESPEFKKVVEERLLMYSFVDGKFMPPDDPLGRHGPSLEQFLRKGGVGASAPLCPYGRKCTYGNKCKFFHPERPGGVHVSVTDRLQGRAQQKKQLSASPSCFEGICGSTGSLGTYGKSPAYRTQSVNFPMMTPRHNSPSPRRLSPMCPEQNRQQQHYKTSHSAASLDTHQALSKQFSTPDRMEAVSSCSGGVYQQMPYSETFTRPPPSIFQSTAGARSAVASGTAENWRHLALLNEHQALSRNVSAPGGERQQAENSVHHSAWGRNNFGVAGNQYFTPSGKQRKGSSSDTQLNLLTTEGDWWPDSGQYSSDCFAPPDSGATDKETARNLFVPSSAVWGSMEYSLGPVPTPDTAESSLHGAVQSQGTSSVCSIEESRKKVYYNLSQIFPEPIVASVMQSNPREINPQILCSMILNIHKSSATMGGYRI